MGEIVELEEFKKMMAMITTWIPVGIFLPEDCLRVTNYHKYLYTESVLVKTANGCFVSKRSRYETDKLWKWVGSKQLNGKVTHWKPFDFNAITDEWAWILLKTHLQK